LESKPAVGIDGAWQLVNAIPVLLNNTSRLLLPASDTTRFFRLRSAPTALPSTNFVIASYQLVSSTPFDPALLENVYTATVSNWSAEDATVSALASTDSPLITLLQGNLNFGEVAAGQTIRSSNTFTLRVPANAPLDLAALSWAIQARPLPPTSFALIDAALQSGAINSETALAYKVYAEMDDALLPALYRGRDDHFDESRALAELEDRFPSLSAPARQLLAPFLMQPNTPGSWYYLQQARAGAQSAARKGLASAAAPSPIVWTKVDTANGQVSIWWDSERRSPLEAERIASEIDTKIYPKLVGLFGPPNPDTDNSVLLPDGTEVPDVTDDERLDIFITDSPRTYTRRADCVGNSAAKFINLGTARSYPTIAHEFTHAILYHFPLKSGCSIGDYRWLHEATATWAKQFVYPDSNAEWDAAPMMLDQPNRPLDYVEGGEGSKLKHAYGAYLWFLFLTQGKDSGAQVVRATWDACATHDTRGAIEESVVSQGGLTKVWPEFALYNWNRGADGSDYRYYYTWDKLDAQVKEEDPQPIQVTLGGHAKATYSVDHAVQNLAAQYFHYDFRGDQSIRSLKFRQPYSEGIEPAAHVSAIIKIKGKGWSKAEDWTPFPLRKLCRDLPDQDFEELVIVISNSETKDPNKILGFPSDPAELEVSSLGCDTWSGVIHNTHNVTFGDSTVTMTDTANVTFEFDEETTGDGMSGQFYRLQSGSFQYSERFDTTRGGIPCSTITTGSGNLPTVDYRPGLDGTSANIVFLPGSDPLQYFAAGFSIVPIRTQDGCSNPPKDSEFPTNHFWWLQSSGVVSADGKTIEGTSDTPDGLGGTLHSDWKLQRP
jgi:hypothetical protein